MQRSTFSNSKIIVTLTFDLLTLKSKVVFLRSWANVKYHYCTVCQLDMCLWNIDVPGGNKVKIWQNTLQVLHFDPIPPHGHVMSVKCEEPTDELTVQVWLLYHQPNFKYCTLFVSGTELWTERQTDINRQTDRGTDRQTIWLLDAPGGPFRLEA